MTENYTEGLIFTKNLDDKGTPFTPKLVEVGVVSENGKIQCKQNIYKKNGIRLISPKNLRKVSKPELLVDTENSYFIYEDRGEVLFSEDLIGQAIVFEYYGTGNPNIGDCRVFTTIDNNGNVTETLNGLLKENRKELDAILKIGGGIIILNRLDELIKNGEILNEALGIKIVTGNILDKRLRETIKVGNETDAKVRETIRVANETDDKLNSTITTGTLLDNSLKSNIVKGNEVDSRLKATIVEGNSTDTKLNTTIDSAQEVIDHIIEGENKNITINPSDWTLNSTTKRYEKLWNHNMNTSNLIFEYSSLKNGKKCGYFMDYEIQDNNNVKFSTESNDTVYAIASARRFTGLKMEESLLEVDKMVDGATKVVMTRDERELLNIHSSQLEDMEQDLQLKANSEYVDNEIAKKRDKTVKIKSSDMDTSTNDAKMKPINISDELMAMFSPAGSTSPIIPNGSLVNEKFANDSVNFDKIDLGLKRNIKVSDIIIHYKFNDFLTNYEGFTIKYSDLGATITFLKGFEFYVTSRSTGRVYSTKTFSENMDILVPLNKVLKIDIDTLELFVVTWGDTSRINYSVPLYYNYKDIEYGSLCDSVATHKQNYNFTVNYDIIFKLFNGNNFAFKSAKTSEGLDITLFNGFSIYIKKKSDKRDMGSTNITSTTTFKLKSNEILFYNIITREFTVDSYSITKSNDRNMNYCVPLYYYYSGVEYGILKEELDKHLNNIQVFVNNGVLGGTSSGENAINIQSGNPMKITLLPPFSLYIKDKCTGATVSQKIVSNKEEHLIPVNQVLVWNILSSTIENISFNGLTFDKYHIPLIYNYGAYYSGLLWEEASKNSTVKNLGLDCYPYLKPPVHFYNEIDRVALSVQSKQKYGETLSFGFITDIHYNKYQSGLTTVPINHLKNIQELSYKVNLDYICIGGDISDGKIAKDKEIRDLTEVMSVAKKSDCPIYALKGNHDDNSDYTATITGNNILSEVISDKEMYNILWKGLEKENVVMANKPGYEYEGYYYKDDIISKTRSIFLNTTNIPYYEYNGNLVHKGFRTSAISDNQVQWFAKALDLGQKANEGWHVIVLSHHPLKITGESPKNTELIQGLINAFKTGTSYTGSDNLGTDFESSVTYDYSGKQGVFVANFYGHAHYDRITEENGIKMASILQSMPLAEPTSWDEFQPSRVIGTLSEDAFDIITINRLERKVYMDRFGAVSTNNTNVRTFSY